MEPQPITADEQFSRHVFNVLRDDRRRYRFASFSLLLGRWYPCRDVVSSGPLWCSDVDFQIQRITYGDPNNVYRISGPDCRKGYWLNGLQISNERAHELGAW